MSAKNSLVSNFKSLWLIMSKEEKIKSLTFIFLTFIAVFLETISIGSLYPLLLGIFNGGSEVFNFFDKNFFLNEKLKNFLASDNAILGISLIVIVIFLIKNMFLIYLVHWSQSFERDVKIRLKSELLATYIKKDYLFHVNLDSAFLVRNITRSTSTVMLSIRGMMMLTNDTAMFIFLLLLMLTISPQFVAYSFLAILILSISYFFVFKRILIKYGKFSFTFEGDSLKRLLQSFTMIKEIKLFNKENYFINFFISEERQFQEFQRKAFIIRSYPKMFFEIIFVFGILIFINLNILNSAETINVILPKTAILTIIIIRLLPSVNKIMHQTQKLNTWQKSNDEIIDELKHSIKNHVTDTDKDHKTEKSYKFQKIKLENVCFRYPDKKNYIFKNFNLELTKGKYLGIVGVSGCGKSTLVDLMTGLLNPESGKITINDQETDLTSKGWKDLFGYVPQNINLFNDTIFSNISFESDIKKVNLDKMNYVIEKSGLNSFIQKLDNGIKTSIGELGYKISGGEKQRISIARALYKDPEILIFDESFNSLDNKTKKNILSEVKELSRIKTIIIITHLKDDLKDCNLVIDLTKKLN